MDDITINIVEENDLISISIEEQCSQIDVIEENDLISILIEEYDSQIDMVVIEEIEIVSISISENQGNSSFNTLQLIVSEDDQTLFNIYNVPIGYSELDINGVTYYYVDDYEFFTSGQNIYLLWLNNFLLQTTDKLIFKTF